MVNTFGSYLGHLVTSWLSPSMLQCVELTSKLLTADARRPILQHGFIIDLQTFPFELPVEGGSLIGFTSTLQTSTVGTLF